MKYKLKYSPDASDKLKEIKRKIVASYGIEVATKVVSKMIRDIRDLQDNPKKGPSVEVILGIPTPYRFLHVEKNYIFYRIETDIIYVTDIYNEREDFLWKMFGVSLRTQDSIDFWGE